MPFQAFTRRDLPMLGQRFPIPTDELAAMRVVASVYHRQLHMRYGWWFRLDPKRVLPYLKMWRDARQK